MKFRDIKPRKIILSLMGVSLAVSIVSDLAYGKIELAKEYMVGQFLDGLRQISFSLAVVFTILYLMYELFIKDFINVAFHDGYANRDIGSKATRTRSSAGRKK